MSTITEDPAIPLVGRNGRHIKFSKYSSTDMELKKKKFETVGCRLAERKKLFTKRKRFCDAALVFAVLGILLAVFETEMTANQVYLRNSLTSYFVKVCITTTTMALLIFIGIYHWIEIKLFTVDNSVDDWKLAISNWRIAKIILEFIVCFIHPIPGQFEIVWPATRAEGQDERWVLVPVDVLLSLPMFLRLYLICRAMMLHSRLYQDVSSQSLGALNRIHFNFRFIFKSMMALHPDYVLTVIMLCLVIIASWALHLCELYDDEVHANYLNSMWLIAVTFLSVGYGDIVPSSYCGRGIAVITGIMGAGCTALVVAVLARKLELSRAEKYVHDFVIDIDYDKKLKHEAANVVKYGWFIYKFRKLKTMPSIILKCQRKLLASIHHIRDIKAGQRLLMDATVTLVEMNKTQLETNREIVQIRKHQSTLETKMDNLDKKTCDIQKKIDSLYRIIKKTELS